MKTPSDELFSLIKSLSPSEKRYFKVEISRAKGANTAYYKLFDVIDKLDVYDEEELLKKHAGEKFARHFPMAKKYLFESLLRELNTFCRNSNSYHSAYHDIQEKLIFVGLLQSRGLYATSRKLLKAAKKIATEREAFMLLLQIQRLEISNRPYIADPAQAEDLVVLHRELERLIEVIRLDNEYLYLQELSLSSFRSSADPRNNNDDLDEFLQHPLLQEKNRPEEHSLRVRYHSTISRISFLKGEYEKAFSHAKASVESMEQLPHQIRENPMIYLPHLHNLFNRGIKIGRYDELETILRKVRALPADSPQVQRFIYESFYNLELNYHALMRNFDKAYALLPAIDKADTVWRSKARTEHRVALMFTSMNICIYMGDYHRALVYANHILDQSNPMPKLHSITRLIFIIIQSELNNLDILDSTIRSTYRHLKKQGHLFRVEEIMLRYLHKLGSTTDTASLQTLLTRTHRDLGDAVADPHEARTLEYFDFRIWIDAKLCGQSIHEYLAAQRRTAAVSQAAAEAV